MKRKAPFVSDEEEQLKAFRKNPKRAMEYLNAAIQAAFEENDPELVLTSLAMVAKAFGITRVAKSVDFKRESLHRMLSKRGNPEWKSLFKIFKALHLRPKLEQAGHAVDSKSSARSATYPGISSRHRKGGAGSRAHQPKNGI